MAGHCFVKAADTDILTFPPLYGLSSYTGSYTSHNATQQCQTCVVIYIKTLSQSLTVMHFCS